MVKSIDLQIENRDGFLWISLPEIIDTTNVLQVEKQIDTKLNPSMSDVMLDFSNVINITSITLGMLMRLRRNLIQLDSIMYLSNISKKCLEQLEKTNLDKVFTIFNN